MDEHASLERRGQTRFALKAPASARVPGQPRIAVRLLDLSLSGCRLMLGTPWPKDTGLWLQIAHLPPLLSQIMWAHERFAGVRFTVPLEESDFADLLATYGALTEHDTKELRSLSLECSRHAQGNGETSTHMARLAEACSAQAIRFDRDREEEQQALIAARTKELLDRLSVKSS